MTELENPHPPDVDLRQRTISGVSWSAASLLLRQSVQVGLSIVLARLLLPADFGLIGMVLVFTGFAQYLNDLGFGAALIQRPHIEERHCSSVFWLNLLLGALIAAALLAGAPLLAQFYREPALVPLTRFISLNFLILPLALVPGALARRRLDFRLVGLIDILSILISGVGAVVLALLGLGVWSLAWQVLIGSALMVIGWWLASRWRPHFVFDRSAIAELWGFSSHMFGTNTLNYWVRNGDNLLVGKFLGDASLGLYTRAYSILLVPLGQVTTVLGRVMFPVLSKVQTNRPLVKRTYLRSIALIGFIFFPLTLGLFATADRFVLLLWGANWIEVTPVLRIFCLAGTVQVITITTAWIYQSQGRADWMFRWTLLSGALSLVGIAIGVMLGSIEAVAALYTLVSSVLLLYPTFAIPGKLIEMTFGEVARSIAGVLGCATVMAVLISLLNLVLPPEWPNWLSLAVQVLCGAAIYSLLARVLRLPAYGEAVTLFMEQAKPRLEAARRLMKVGSR
ncbi:MAG TPA: MOP flippase family protein [Anaerolineae bacterium]|nr:MOP flippase family protein [Anaerolineae bacterium]